MNFEGPRPSYKQKNYFQRQSWKKYMGQTVIFM